ncbi:ABC transporter permease subunit [Chelatococcus sp. SYSU_G07232]|uniref:ABC transporter permease subunit n=1 Tax=Chelatococcus albus TaxID=3047466 RepID=A0ABT7AK49_9HYPH|nr:ABC transporter permease subunit [Chelatococcus sp. SYSU_G07232]MDJ1159352.1 ABC transporter permease subunit [Chelatococcus sp. SYSU_G07232]
MTAEALPAPRAAARPLSRIFAGAAGPVAVVVLALLAVWYVAAVLANWSLVAEAFARGGIPATFGDVLAGTLGGERPVLPAPHQILAELWKTVVDTPVTSRRSLVLHGWVTLSSTLLGFAIGALTGIVLAVAIVHLRMLEKSLMPWIISSQTVPILAIAPIIIVVLGSIGIRGVLPKSIISAYLCFFPVTIGMVKGLTSPDVLQRDLMRTYSASVADTLWKLRLPASVPYLFASLKVAVAISLVGAIVAELPTGAQAGLGARLLAGSYYGQTIQIWAALFAAAILAAALVAVVGMVERLVLRAMGARR